MLSKRTAYLYNKSGEHTSNTKLNTYFFVAVIKFDHSITQKFYFNLTFKRLDKFNYFPGPWIFSPITVKDGLRCSPIDPGLVGFRYGRLGFSFGRYWSVFGCIRVKTYIGETGALLKAGNWYGNVGG